jgi:hypothetical protein
MSVTSISKLASRRLECIIPLSVRDKLWRPPCLLRRPISTLRRGDNRALGLWVDLGVSAMFKGSNDRRPQSRLAT